MRILWLRCNQPSLDGLVITAFVNTANKSAAAMITLSSGSIKIALSSGSGSTFALRNFTGSGVSGFDTSLGAQIDSTLTDVTPATTKSGTLGAITNISGSLDCGDQTPGISSVVVNGSSAEGSITGSLSPFKVECQHNAANGNNVALIGLIDAGDTPNLLFINLNNRTPSIYTSTKDNVFHAYTAAASSSVSQEADGAMVDSNFIETVTSGTPHVIHLTGSVTCGATVETGITN
jgi:hypothetical protein